MRRLVERITKQKGLSLIEKYTYNDKGQELSYTRIKENDYKYRLDFSYETDEKDRLWKRGSVGGEILVFEVLDKLGKILFNTEISFPEDNNLDPEDLGYNEIIYNHNIYKYDINDRIIDQYSYNDLYAGNYLHLDYQEEDGIKTTKIIEYPLYVLGENITDMFNTLNNRFLVISKMI